MKNLLTVSELTQIITSSSNGKTPSFTSLAGQTFYIIKQKEKKIVGKIKFLPVSISKIVIKDTYTTIEPNIKKGGEQIDELHFDEGDKCPDKTCNGNMVMSYTSDVYGYNRVWVCAVCGITESE